VTVFGAMLLVKSHGRRNPAERMQLPQWVLLKSPYENAPDNEQRTGQSLRCGKVRLGSWSCENDFGQGSGATLM
jgi:hypothetical protein